MSVGELHEGLSTDVWRNKEADPMGSPVIMRSFADEGFYQTIRPEAARQQFNMSLGLVAGLSAIAVVVGMSAGFNPMKAGDPAVRQARIVVQAPQPVHVMQAQRDVNHRG
jgi:hypothetical protein